MSNIGRDSATLLAGLQIDLLAKFRNNQLTTDHLEWFLGLNKEQRDQFTNTTKMGTLPGRILPDPWSRVEDHYMSVYVVIEDFRGHELTRRGFTPPINDTIFHMVVCAKEDAGLERGMYINLGTKSNLNYEVVGWDPKKRKITVRLIK